MGTVWIREFTGGLDTRRLPETTAGGVLIVARDGHITRGGEFEKRAAFVKLHTLPVGTIGLAADVTSLIVFGHDPAPVLPADVLYQRLQHPTVVGMPLSRILSYDLFAGNVYAVAEFEDDSIHHYFNGAHVTSWVTMGYATGTFALTAGKKLYSVAGPNAHFSGINTPTDFNPATTGAGFIDMSSEASGSQNLQAIAKYQNLLAFFAERAIQTWHVDPDPALNKQVQVLNNTGTLAPGSVTQFGDDDVFYLDVSGLRSLRARDASNSASTTDIGVSVDTLIVADLQGKTLEQLESITGLIEPDSGRFWLVIGGRIFVFSYFSEAKVSAWSTYEPGFIIDYALPFKRRVYVRSGDDIYVYGGIGDSLTYDATQAEAQLPYLDANKPSERKKWTGVDAACTGVWEVRVAMHPTDLEASDKIATIAGTTYSMDKIGGLGESTHLSLRFKSNNTGPALLSAAVIHYEGDDGDKD